MGAAYALLGYLAIAASPERIPTGLGYLQDALTIMQETGDKIGLNNALNLLGNGQNLIGDFRGAWATFTQDREVCFAIGAAAETGQALRALIAETGTTEPESRLNALMAEVLARQGRLAEARAAAALARESAEAAQAHGVRVRSQKVEAWLALQAQTYP